MATYPVFDLRKQMVLDGFWDFCWLEQKVSLQDFSPAQIEQYPEKTAVPSVFDLYVTRFQKRGLGVYRKWIDGMTGTCFRLHAEGLGLAGRIFWDGKEIGQADYPYAALDFDFKSHSAERHELVIAVDNRFESQKYPFMRDFYDFYAFGGIYRSMTLYQVPDLFLDRVHVRTVDEICGKVQLEIFVRGDIQAGQNLDISYHFDHTAEKTVNLFFENGRAVAEFTVPDHHLWEPDDPHLHLLHLTLPVNGDRITERFGIRRLDWNGRHLLLNGKKLYLRGVNRHCSHAEFGPVESPMLIADDLNYLKTAGFNFIRCVHYPHNQAFFDLCDEMGFLCWEETLGWGLSSKGDLVEEVLPFFLEQNRKMLHASMNHPAVIIWGYLNECASHLPESVSFYQALTRAVHEQDFSRPVSYASNRKEFDVCFDAADLIAINCYPGWFEDITDSVTLASDLIEPHLKRMAEYFDQDAFRNKPLIISEIGVCGLAGVRDWNKVQWSEDFQADYMVEACRATEQNPRYCGFALWQMFDSRSYNRGQIRGKPKGFNCAGLLDEYRRPKLAYFMVKDYFRQHGVPDERIEKNETGKI